MKWFLNNQILEKNQDCNITTENGKSTLKIKNADKKKVGKYEVVIEKNNVLAKSASSVKIKKGSDEDNIVPPTFIRPLRPTTAGLGDIILLETEVDSSPCASFQWFIGSKEVASYLKENKIHNMYITNRDNVSCLCVENVTTEIVGIITCRAENFAGSVSSSASLNILPNAKEVDGRAPEFITPLKSTTVMDGDPIILKCEVIGQPWPKIDWYYNGKSIDIARDITIGRQESGLCELCIKEAFPEMTGIYGVKAVNEFGTCTCECLVNVEGSSKVSVSKCM